MSDVRVPAGWYTDPSDATMLRYWTGEAWTDSVRPLQNVASQAEGQAAVQSYPSPVGQPVSQPVSESSAQVETQTWEQSASSHSTPQPNANDSIPAYNPFFTMVDVKKGKSLLIAVTTLFLGMSLLATLLSVATTVNAGSSGEAAFDLIQGLIRFALECVLFLLIFKGYNWARIVTLVLFSIGLALALFSAFLMPVLPTTMVTMLVMSLIYGFAIYVLASRPVRLYQRYKRPRAQ